MFIENNNQLYKKFEFNDFSENFAIITRVALAVEIATHGPLWSNVWNRVEIWLTTDDSSKIVTEKDTTLAYIPSIANKLICYLFFFHFIGASNGFLISHYQF